MAPWFPVRQARFYALAAEDVGAGAAAGYLDGVFVGVGGQFGVDYGGGGRGVEFLADGACFYGFWEGGRADGGGVCCEEVLN